MSFIEYIQRAFVFCGALLITVVAFRWVLAQVRRIKIYKLARRLLDRRPTLHEMAGEMERRYGPPRRVRLNITRHEIEFFCSQVSTSDISNDAFLKELVEQLLAIKFPDQESDTIIESPSPANG